MLFAVVVVSTGVFPSACLACTLAHWLAGFDLQTAASCPKKRLRWLSGMSLTHKLHQWYPLMSEQMPLKKKPTTCAACSDERRFYYDDVASPTPGTNPAAEFLCVGRQMKLSRWPCSVKFKGFCELFASGSCQLVWRSIKKCDAS